MKNKYSGFTLIELLIAISILSALLFTGTYSYQMLAERWEKELGQFNESSKTAKNINLLYDLLRGVQPFIILDEQQNKTKPAFFFIGKKNSLLSVSTSGLFTQDYPEIFRIVTQQNKDGSFDLVYQSISSKDILLLTPQQEIKFSHQTVLLKNLDQVKFDYFGWNGFMERTLADETGKTAIWSNRFSGIDRQMMPEKMQLTITRKDRQISFMMYFDQSAFRFISPFYDS